MKARSNLFRELRKSLRPGPFAEQVTAQTDRYKRMRIGRSTAPGISNTVDQAAWRTKYAACVVEWNDLNDEQKAAYQEDADKRRITAFNQFMSTCLLEVVPPPEYEDFTTYTEVDIAADRIQRTAQHVDHRALRDESTYLYDDKGANHFSGNWEHLVDIRTDFEANSCLGVVWGLSNYVGDMGAHLSASEEHLIVFVYRADGTPEKSIKLSYLKASTIEVDAWQNAVPNTWYYLTIKRVGAVLTCDIYSDSDRTNKLTTLTIPCPETAYRHIYACNTRNSGAADACDDDIDNLALQE